MRKKFRRWMNFQLLGLAGRIVRRVAEDDIHNRITRAAAVDVVSDIRTLRAIITP